MARKRKGRAINGVLLIDKPQGGSSNHVVQRVKRLFKAAKAGHTGALDPLATGLLPVCLGEATKFSQFLLDADKAYFVTAKLGQRTDTSDADGEIVESREFTSTSDDIKAALSKFIGPIKQVPSMFSALKHNGKPLYYYARQGIEIDRPARDITIHDIQWIELNGDELSLHVRCSKGTYIRSLVDDLGQHLGCGAHVKVLRRTHVGHYDTKQMITFEQLDAIVQSFDESPPPSNEGNPAIQENLFEKLDAFLLPMDTPILSLPKLVLSDTQTEQFQRGMSINVSAITNAKFNAHTQIRIYCASSLVFLGVAFITQDNLLQPKRVVVHT